MQPKELMNFLNDTTFLNQIETSKIPNINLYMDQALTFMNENLEHFKRKPDDKILTKPMINNYVKNDLIPKPENKKYLPNHIISLVYIFYLKQILTFDDIQTILESYTEKHFNSDGMTDLYDVFLAVEKSEEQKLESELKELAGILYSDSMCEKFDSDEMLFLFIMLLSSKANSYKVIIEKLLDNNCLSLHLPKK
jgi:hypothetical protein